MLATTLVGLLAVVGQLGETLSAAHASRNCSDLILALGPLAELEGRRIFQRRLFDVLGQRIVDHVVRSGQALNVRWSGDVDVRKLRVKRDNQWGSQHNIY